MNIKKIQSILVDVGIYVREIDNVKDVLMKSLFEVLPEDFFKPFTSKYKKEYADCIMLLFNSFKSEISYGVNRDIVVKELENYFEIDDIEMSFDDENYISDAREKSNGVIAYLKNCGWIEYEEEKNHQLNVVLQEYTIPIIESMNKVISQEETEYQGIISQIHSSLQNKELYVKPYELIIKGVKENTERLISELKRLNASIKRHMDKQTSEMDAAEILDHFFVYHTNIGSKAYLRMKTSENVSYFRSAIIAKIEELMESSNIMDRAVAGYMDVEQEEDKDIAYDRIVSDLLDVKSMFYRLDEIIEEIDRKHTRYMKNAVMRARFKLSTGNNMEGKISRILDYIAEDINNENSSIYDINEELNSIFNVYQQGFVSTESLKTIPVSKKHSKVDCISDNVIMTEEERALYKEALRMKNRKRFSRKNIDEYVNMLLKDREKISVDEIPIESKRDLIRIIYIRIYGGNKANKYKINRTDKKVNKMGYTFPLFEIIKQ